MNRGVYETRERARKAGYTQNQVARLVGADPGNFSRLLRAERPDPSVDVVLGLHRELGVDPSWWREEILTDSRAQGGG